MRKILLAGIITLCLASCGKKPNVVQAPENQRIPNYPAIEPIPN
jgi:hypothetical protein